MVTILFGYGLVDQNMIASLAPDSTVILKISRPQGYGGANESRWLSSFKVGVPKVLGVDGTRCAFLMERVLSGVPLKILALSVGDDQATHIIAQTIRNLQANQQPTVGFKGLTLRGGDALFC